MSCQALGSRLLVSPRVGRAVGTRALNRPIPQDGCYITPWQCSRCRQRLDTWRYFSASAGRRKGNEGGNDSGPFRTRLRVALKKTKIEWYPIPVGLGIGFLGLVQFYRTQQSAKARQKEEDEQAEEDRGEKPKKRKRIRPSGPWYARQSFTAIRVALSAD